MNNETLEKTISLRIKERTLRLVKKAVEVLNEKSLIDFKDTDIMRNGIEYLAQFVIVNKTLPTKLVD